MNDYIFIRSIEDRNILIDEAVNYYRGLPNRLENVVLKIELNDALNILMSNGFLITDYRTLTIMNILDVNQRTYYMFTNEIFNKYIFRFVNYVIDEAVNEGIVKECDNVEYDRRDLLLDTEQEVIMKLLCSVISEKLEVYKDMKNCFEDLSNNTYTEQEFSDIFVQKLLDSIYRGYKDIVINNRNTMTLNPESLSYNDKSEINNDDFDKESKIVMFPKNYDDILPEANEIKQRVSEYNSDEEIKAELRVISNGLIEASKLGRNYIVIRDLRDDVIRIVKSKKYSIVKLEGYNNVYLIVAGKVKKSELTRIYEIANDLNELGNTF